MAHSIPPFITAQEMTTILSRLDTTRLFSKAIEDPGFHHQTPHRLNIPNGAGHLLLMPSQIGSFYGIKIAAVVPDNPLRGEPRIQATYLLLDATTMQLLASFDGAALTLMRTPALSAAVARLITPDKPLSVTIFGTGPQALSHANYLSDIREIRALSFVSQKSQNSAKVAERLQFQSGSISFIQNSNTSLLQEVVGDSDLVITATSSQTPLFDSNYLGESSGVISIGSHEPDRAEIDSKFLARARIFVEEKEIAKRESGEIAQAVAARTIELDEIYDLNDLLNLSMGDHFLTSPRFYKSVGMAWQDLLVATEIYKKINS
jgi:ornithine cyclodeaminase/alanine dehydrogenase-like protein (mu-crystallin family)